MFLEEPELLHILCTDNRPVHHAQHDIHQPYGAPMADMLEGIARCASHSKEYVATPLTQMGLCRNRVTLMLFLGEEKTIRVVQKEVFIICGVS